MMNLGQKHGTDAKNTPMQLIGVGEVLLDVFEEGRSTVGGAPLNVTFHLHQLLTTLELGQATIVSAVGNDAAGTRILQYLADFEMDTSFVSHIAEKPTGSALVFSHEGSAGFEIAQDVAWDDIQSSPRLLELAARSSAVVFGSLAQRGPVTHATIQQLVAAVAGERLYDVNLRVNTRTKIAGYSAEILHQSLTLATIAKMNDEELETVAEMLDFTSALPAGEERQRDLIHKLAHGYQLSVVALTRGAKGAIVLCDGEEHALPDSTLAQQEIHPVGAGDSFAAGLLFGRVQKWPIASCLKLAETMANWVVLHESATPRFTPQIINAVRAIQAEVLNAEKVTA